MLAVLHRWSAESSKDSLECERRVESLLLEMCLCVLTYWFWLVMWNNAQIWYWWWWVYDMLYASWTYQHSVVWLICRMNDSWSWWSPFSWNCVNFSASTFIDSTSTGCNTNVVSTRNEHMICSAIWYTAQHCQVKIAKHVMHLSHFYS